MVTAKDHDGQVLLFHCTRQDPDELAGFSGIITGTEKVNKIEVPCSGRVGTGEIMQGLASGYERIIVLSCGENSCVHRFGCIEAKKAMDTARNLAAVAGADTTKLIFIEADDPAAGVTQER